MYIYIYTEEWSSLRFHHYHGGCRLNGGAIWIVFSLYSHYTTIIFPKIMYMILPYITIYYTHYYITIILPICIWGLSKIMVPENCPYAALSRTFRALSRPSRIGTRDYDQVFVCKFATKICRRTVFKNITY